MIERFKNGLKLVQASWAVLRADRELLVLPILSLLSSIGLIAMVFFGLFVDDVRIARLTGEAPMPDAFEWMILAVVGYALTYIAIFFNVALVCAADERMSGGDPTVRSALSDASRHALAIAPWALVSVVAALILRVLRERAGIVGRIAARILGFAWGVLTYLVLPVLILEGLTVREAIARSKDLLVKTWGEAASGEVGMSLVTFVALLAGVPFALLIGGGGQPGWVLLAVILFVVWVLLVSVVMGALNMVFRVAIYRYAADGETPAEFEGLDLEGIFGPGGRRSPLGGGAAA